MKPKPAFFTLLALISSLIVFAGGCAAPSNDSGESSSTENQASTDKPEGDAAEDQQERGVPVRVQLIARGPISDGIFSTSVVEAEQSVDIYSRVTGTVTKIAAEEGQTIRAGQLLCQLEDEELQLTESKSKAEMDKLERDLERTKTLVEQKILTETDLINAQYAYEQAQLTWRQANTSLEYTTIQSTIDGIVFERLVRLGQKVDPSIKLYSMFNPNSLVINVHVPENDFFSKVNNKADATQAIITSESLPGTDFTGRIKRIAPIVDTATNTIKITLVYSDPKRILRPGMYVRVKLVTDVRETAILVPRSAIMYDDNQQYVFLIRDGKAERVNLDTGYSDALQVESLKGIEEGDQVVVVGQNGLKNGTKVRIIESGENTAGEE